MYVQHFLISQPSLRIQSALPIELSVHTMAELVRPKKPRHRERPQSENAPTIPDRPVMVNGLRMPAAPSHTIEQRERSASPEPEEQLLSEADDQRQIESDSESANVRSSPVRPAPPPPRTSQERDAPPIPPRNLVFPRSTSMVAESTREPTPVVAQKRSIAVAPYPTVPELAELPSYTAALQHSHVYPSVNGGQLQHSHSATALPEKTRFSAPVERVREGEAPPMYPSIDTFERNEHGLMTEDNLVTFYHNPLYEQADVFVDQFIKTEEVPTQSGTLFPLLTRLKSVCDSMTISEVKGKENTEELQKCLRECWVQQAMSVEAKGKCGDNNDGTGRASYFSYELQQAVLDQMKRLLATNRTNLMDHTLCEETSFRSLALQIQWQIIIINNNFMAENGLTTNCPPSLVATGAMTPGRTALRTALSDIFYHLRYPRLSKRFIDTLVGWIKELTCILNMRQSCDDGIFILCHLLRLPSPIDQWAAPFIQTFIQSQSPPRIKLDYCIALLTHLLNPIKARESFLRHVAQSEKEESAWEILADDDDGEANEFSFVTISESDLTAFLDQIPISEVYSIAYLAFTSYSDKGSQFTAMIAFQLLLMKVLDNGLTSYSQPGYKMFCKQIGISLKHSVRELSTNWRLIREQIRPGEEAHLQKEVDRIVLLALNYLIHRDSVGLFQFVVSLPYNLVSEECRSRCEYALRSDQKMSIHEIYETPICEVRAKTSNLSISKRVTSLGPQDSEFLINSLATIGSFSNSDVAQLLKELIDVCFCDESTRDDFYKCGGEAIGQILRKRPETLHQLLTIVDRNLQHMDSYAINVLSSSRLFECRLTEPMISIIGKWLINNPPENGANRLARRVLSGLHWGLAADGHNLWIDVDVHAIAADTIVKAHSVHCSRSNSMISKSISKISKLASKVGDAESLFQQFCWDLLVKLKLPTVPVALVQNDLTAHYVKIVQNYEDDVVVYLEKAVPLLSDLVTSGSSVASVVLLSRLIAQHYQSVNLMAADKNFMSTFERLLHIDQLPYAVQWLSGPSSTPTPIVRLICSAISYYSAKLPPRDYLRAWITLLCLARTGWNEDAVTYQIVGTIARIAFISDTQKLYEITSIIFQAYQQQLAAEKNQSKGLLSMFSSDNTVSPLIPDSMLSVSPFASYIMLRVEQKSFNTFYGHFFETLAKKDKYNLDHAVKKAASKCSMTVPVERIAVFRWAKLISLCKDNALLPILLQQLAGSAYRLRKGNNLNLCYARRLIDEPQMQDTMSECRKAIEDSTVEMKGLGKAVVGWLFTKHEVTRTGFDFSIFDLDYLLQLILAGDKNMWLDFVNMPHFNSEEFAERKLYSTTCQLLPKESPTIPDIGSPRSRGSAKPFPVLPVHSGLPQAPQINPSTLFQQHTILQLTAPFIASIKNLAKQYTECGDRMTNDDDAYYHLIRVLYQPTQQTIPVEIRCSYCSKPKACTMTVKPNVLNPETDIKMSQNRNRRIEFWNELNVSLIDKAAVATASIEHLSKLVAKMAGTLHQGTRNNVQITGHSLFYLITSSVGENELLFSVASEAYTHSLRSLGEEFVKFRPEEQMDVMQLALDGFVLSEPLVEVFTPEVLNSDDLCRAYKKLSDAVRMPERSKMALQLLGEQ
ncbi:CBN-EPG-5 protein [Caenorhabditis brenneri]|uniref:CBN-EPG-5 protein n=1 Tax=Caenorhabditis brenneri TaxID=135651 RepID=G0NR31_CAEBE|nr:CBN-EPG-5 protein [Caenorhabditis brenneri]